MIYFGGYFPFLAQQYRTQVRANRTPAQKEYARTYNRLKQRKVRGKISMGEWNAGVAKAQELVERSERGKPTDKELREKLGQL